MTSLPHAQRPVSRKPAGEAGEPAGEPSGGAVADPADAAALVHAHQGMVWRYLRLCGADPHEADDLMQDTFVAFLTGSRLLAELASPEGFLRGIARHLLLAARRRSRCAPPTADWLAAVDHLAAADPHAFADERLPALQACLERLAPRARQALAWHHVEGMPRREVAARLELGDEGAKSLLERTRELLRDCVARRLTSESPR